jgi:hypothetical protein
MRVQLGGIKRQVAFGLAAVFVIGVASTLSVYFAFSDGADAVSSDPGTSIPRKPARDNAAAPLSADVAMLFSAHGKNDRADYVAQQIASAREAMEALAKAEAHTGSVDPAPEQQHAGRDSVQFVAASLTPLDMARPGPTRVAGAFQQSVNRGGKGDRIAQIQHADAPQPAAESSTIQTSSNAAEPVQTASAPESDAGMSAALFMLSPSAPTGAPVEDGEEGAPAKTASASADSDQGEPQARRAGWADLIKLASITGGDGEKIKSGIFGGLSENEFRAREFRCMATAIYFEARGESINGQIAVGQVIMTRVRSDFYPNTICGVVYQGQWNRNSCQFSFACDGEPDTPKDREKWEVAIDVAKKVISGQAYLKDVGDATHYHATYVSPDWRKLMTKVTKVGVHIFYKAPFVQPLVASAEFKGL